MQPIIFAPGSAHDRYQSPTHKSWSPLAAARALKSDIDLRKGNLTLSLKELCKAAQVSEREMRRTFKRLFQVAPREYQCRARIEHAVTVLTNNPVASIDELAVQLGYADRADFAKCFKKRVGIAPGEYRLCAKRNYGIAS
jgi:transcriptional regulator GlxA family with amidase domain